MRRPESLTPRHLEVLRAIARHGSPRAAAEELGISVETVKSHTAQVRQRLGARTTHHAVAIAIQKGIV